MSTSTEKAVDWPCAFCGRTTVDTEREIFARYGGMPMAYRHTDCTPEKFEFGDNPMDAKEYRIYSATDPRIAGISKSLPNAEERARFFAAAPDLYEALRDLVAEIRYLIDDGTLRRADVEKHPSFRKAEAALSKAVQR